MSIINGTMIPLARMERGCPQSGRGRGQAARKAGGGEARKGLNSYKSPTIHHCQYLKPSIKVGIIIKIWVCSMPTRHPSETIYFRDSGDTGYIFRSIT